MIFLPNKLERYVASLRISVGKMIEKNGYTEKNYEMLKKIHRAEAMFLTIPYPCDIKILLSSVLLKAYLKIGESFEFRVYVNQNYIINKKLLISLILSLCQKCKKIFISEFKNCLLIRADCKIESELTPIVKKLCGVTFYEIKGNSLNILIPVKATEKRDIYIKKDLEALQGPMSVINFYIR